MRRVAKQAAGGALVACSSVLLRPGTPANRLARHALRSTGRHLRYSAGRLQGAVYHFAGRHPDDSVFDTVLADRIRSELGPLEKRRDIPRVHVMVENHVALLHGDLPTQADVQAIEAAVAKVAGVASVESHLKVGLISGETRPSEGRHH